MANQCHSDQHGHHQGVFCLLLAIFILCGVAGCSAYTIRHHKEPNESTSASYMDPAADQVDIDRFYFPTDEGLREFQQILLRELGLSRVPDLSKVNITREEYDRQRQSFAQDVTEYRQFSTDNRDGRNSVGHQETVILNHRNVKATRRSKKVTWSLSFRAPSSWNNSSRWLPASSHPLELRWSPDRNRSSPTAAAALRRNPMIGGISWTLYVDQDRPNSPDVVVIRPDAMGTSVDSSFSVKPDLGPLLDRWLNALGSRNGSDGHVLAVRVVCQGRNCLSLRHLRLSAQLRLLVRDPEQEEEEEEGEGEGVESRVKRHANKKKTLAAKSVNNNSNNNNSKKRTAPQPKDILLAHPSKKGAAHKSGGSDCTGSKRGKKCCPHSLKINFRQLPGFDWILEPSEIDIFMCKGDCHYAQFTAHGHHQHSSNPANNHALFQGYLHTINKRLVPKLCCTPSKLDSVQVVHYDQDNPAQLTTTKWEGAIVRECACA